MANVSCVISTYAHYQLIRGFTSHGTHDALHPAYSHADRCFNAHPCVTRRHIIPQPHMRKAQHSEVVSQRLIMTRCTCSARYLLSHTRARVHANRLLISPDIRDYCGRTRQSSSTMNESHKHRASSSLLTGRTTQCHDDHHRSVALK